MESCGLRTLERRRESSQRATLVSYLLASWPLVGHMTNSSVSGGHVIFQRLCFYSLEIAYSRQPSAVR